MRISSSSNRGVNINIDNIVIVLFSVLANVRAEIIKPWGEWMCNYCAMGAPEDSDECGTPILCLFYGLLLLIILFTIYTTIKGTRE